jgi:SAM-dependent MidA family methyltransferase
MEIVRDNEGVPSSLDLAERIGGEICRLGPISFARFMELALYDPSFGYYRKDPHPFGRGGDFYTAEQLQPVFGELMESFVTQVADGTYSDFSVCEVGSGLGDMSQALARWNYRGCDFDDRPLPSQMHGLVLANEFFDALPVHLLRRREEAWCELRVAAANGRFEFISNPLLSPELAEYAKTYGQSVPAGGLLEVNLGADQWLRAIAGFLRSGYLLVIDYGYQVRELVRFPYGSLMSYRKHQAVEDVLANPGQQDITSHVNLTALTDSALRSGFEFVVSQSFASWVLSIWPEGELSRRWQSADARWRLQWKQLVYGMGESFQILLLRKPPAK